MSGTFRTVRRKDGSMVRVMSALDALPESAPEVFEMLGISLVWAQAMEQALATYLAVVLAIVRRQSSEEFRVSVDDLNRLTLSVLLKQLRPHLLAEEVAVLDEMGDVVERRNFVAHHFLRKASRRALLNSTDGCEQLITEAIQDAIDFRAWSARLTVLITRHADALAAQAVALTKFVRRIESGEDIDPLHALEIAEIMERIEKGADGD